MFELKIINLKYSVLDFLVVPVFEDINIHSDNTILQLITKAKKTTGFEANFGEIVTLLSPLDLNIKRVTFIGLGKYKKINSNKLRSLAAKAVNHGINLDIKHMVYAMPSISFDELGIKIKNIFKYIMEGIVLSNYVYNDYKTKKNKNPITKITLLVMNEDCLNFYEMASEIEIICSGTVLARQLVNIPSNEKKPYQFIELIKNFSKNLPIDIVVLNKDWLINNNFDAMLSVGQGSASDPSLLVMEYKPDDFKKTVLFLGKGVTFDSGGINLKPSLGLEEMKTDMAGGAAVAATLIAIAKLKKTRKRVLGVIPLVENMPSGKAVRPGDIVNTFFGKTVEIINTDAEGRLVLADAMAWAIKKYSPDITIDIATLTGACAVALGENIAGVFSNDDRLARTIVEVGNETFERCWHMPIPDDYCKYLKSDLADLRNISTSKWGGAITAAAFLLQFVEKTKWAHIDIAGPARLNKKTDYCQSGGTGFGVRLLSELLNKLF